jgi:hypothetical protein
MDPVKRQGGKSQMTYEEEHVAFHYELGLAIAQWAAIESTLAHLAAFCVTDIRNHHVLYVSFFSIENFRSKLQFADSLLLAKSVENKRIIDWPAICNRLKVSQKKRNRLAHWAVTHFLDNPTEGRRIALIPWPKSANPTTTPTPTVPKRKVKPPSGAICLRELNGIRLEFYAAHVALVNLGAQLRGYAEPLPKAAEQPKRPMTIRTLSSRIHEALGHLPKSSRRKSLPT